MVVVGKVEVVDVVVVMEVLELLVMVDFMVLQLLKNRQRTRIFFFVFVFCSNRKPDLLLSIIIFPGDNPQRHVAGESYFILSFIENGALMKFLDGRFPQRPVAGEKCNFCRLSKCNL